MERRDGCKEWLSVCAAVPPTLQQEWLLTRASAASAAGIQVLVPTSDRLMPAAPPGKQQLGRRARRPRAAAPDTPPPAATLKRGRGDAGALPPPISAPQTPERVDGSADVPDSPVALWVSPSAAPPSPFHSGLTTEAAVDRDAAAAAIDGVLHALLADVAGAAGEAPAAAADATLTESTSFKFQAPTAAAYPDRWPLGRVSIDGNRPEPPDALDRCAPCSPTIAPHSTLEQVQHTCTGP